MTTAFELNWHPYQNAAPPDESTIALQCKYLVWAIAALLLGNLGGATLGLWTHEGSSDSVTAGFDATNRFLAVYDQSKIVRGASSSARSWIVLKSPVGLGPWYVLIDYNTSFDYQINVTFSKSPFSGGSTTSLPTATNSWTNSSLQLVPNILAGQHIFFILSSTGEWHIKFTTTSTNKSTFGLSFFTLAGIKTGDAHNGWSYAEYSASGVWTASTLKSASNTTIKGRSKDGTVAVNAYIPRPLNGSGTDALDDVGTIDAVDGLMNEMPAFLVVYTSGHKSVRGRLQDVVLAPSTASSASVEPLTGPPYDSRIVGAFWFYYGWSSTPLQ